MRRHALLAVAIALAVILVQLGPANRRARADNNIPDLTMLTNAKMRVLARSMTVRLKCRKCFAPAVPVSTTVVTPDRNE